MDFTPRKHWSELKPEIKMAPMIDVVFLLLIFFLCVTNFRALEGNIRTNLPAKGGSPAKLTNEQMDLEFVTITLKNRGGFVSIQMNDLFCTDFEDLFQKLSDLRKKADIPVIIDGDAGVKFKYVMTALNVAMKSRFSKVSFAAPVK